MASSQPRYLLSLEFKGIFPGDKSHYVFQVLNVALDEQLRYVANSEYNGTKTFGIDIPIEQNDLDKRLTFKSKTQPKQYAGKPTLITFSEWNFQTKKWDDKVSKSVEENDQISIFEKARVSASANYDSAKLKAQNTYRGLKNDERGLITYVDPVRKYVKPQENQWPQNEWVELENIRVPFTLMIDKLTVPIRSAAAVRNESFTISFTGFIKVGNRIVESIYVDGCHMIGLKESASLAKAEIATCKATTNCILLDTKIF